MLISVLMASPSLAQTYSVDFPIVKPAPTNTTGRSKYIAINSYAVAQGYPDQTVPSDWSYIYCEVENGNVNLVFEADPNAWPTSFPATATCTSGGYTLVANLTDVPMNNDYDPAFTPSMGISIASAPNLGFGRTYILPTGPTYTEGTWVAKLSPSVDWTGVGCTMKYGVDGTTPFFQISALPTAAADSGFCVLQSASGVPHSIAVTITR